MNTANTKEALQENMNELASLLQTKPGVTSETIDMLSFVIAAAIGNGSDEVNNDVVRELITYVKENPDADMSAFTQKLYSLLPTPKDD